VYLFHGLKDEVVNFGILDKIDHFYHYFTVDGEVNTGEGFFFLPGCIEQISII
jgi:hypothetical protein